MLARSGSTSRGDYWMQLKGLDRPPPLHSAWPSLLRQSAVVPPVLLNAVGSHRVDLLLVVPALLTLPYPTHPSYTFQEPLSLNPMLLYPDNIFSWPSLLTQNQYGISPMTFQRNGSRQSMTTSQQVSQANLNAIRLFHTSRKLPEGSQIKGISPMAPAIGHGRPKSRPDKLTEHEHRSS